MILIKFIILFFLLLQTILLLFFTTKSITQRNKFKYKELNTEFTEKYFEIIDVIIAARENFEIIDKCIYSVICSGFKNIIVCIDGGEYILVDKLKNKYPLVKFLYNKSSEGKIKSQLKCLSTSNKEYVLILDADITLIPCEINNFLSYYFSTQIDFLCPYSIGNSNNIKSLLFSISESDRYMRQRLVRAGRDAFDISNLSGYCIIANKSKYIDIIDSEAIQDDVIATINLLKNGYKVKTYHKVVCMELERISLISYILQKTRWTAGNIVLLKSYITLFREIELVKALAFSSSFLLWYWSLWVDFIAMLSGYIYPSIYILLIIEWIIKYRGLNKVSLPAKRKLSNALYIIIWPIFSTICLILSPYYLKGKIIEQKTRRQYGKY